MAESIPMPMRFQVSDGRPDLDGQRASLYLETDQGAMLLHMDRGTLERICLAATALLAHPSPSVQPQ